MTKAGASESKSVYTKRIEKNNKTYLLEIIHSRKHGGSYFQYNCILTYIFDRSMEKDTYPHSLDHNIQLYRLKTSKNDF